jgi:hypothetical protein
VALDDSELTAYSCGGSLGVAGISKFQRTGFPLSFAFIKHKEPLHGCDFEPRHLSVKMDLREVRQNIFATALLRSSSLLRCTRLGNRR